MGLVPKMTILPSQYADLNTPKILIIKEESGAGDEIRTHDIYLGKTSVPQNEYAMNIK